MEGRERPWIDVFSFRKGPGKPVTCGTDRVTACPGPKPAAR